MSDTQEKPVEEKPRDPGEAITAKQATCPHPGPYASAGQQAYNERSRGVIVLINTIICPLCAKTFVETKEINVFPTLPMDTPGPEKKPGTGNNHG